MTESAHVRGQVWRPDGHAATDAVVTLTDPRGAQVGSATTQANGAFTVPVPAEGRFLMVVAAPGHEPWVRYVTVAGADVEMPVVLTEPAPTAGTTFSAFDTPADPAPRPTPRTAPSPQPPPATPAPQVPQAPNVPQGGSAPQASPASRPAPTPEQAWGAPTAWPPQADPRPAPQPAARPGFSVPPEPPAAHVASAPAEGFAPREPERTRRQDETTALAAQAALDAIAEGRQLPAHSLYGLVTALLASRIDLENDPASALARTAARIGGTRGTSLPESQDAADAILAPLARQLLTDDEPTAARHVRRDDAADPENVIALLRPLIEALATDLESRTAR